MVSVDTLSYSFAIVSISYPTALSVLDILYMSYLYPRFL